MFSYEPKKHPDAQYVLTQTMTDEPRNTKKGVKAISQGEGKGVRVPITRAQLLDIGVDPDKPIRVTRSTMGGDAIRLRPRNVEE